MTGITCGSCRRPHYRPDWHPFRPSRGCRDWIEAGRLGWTIAPAAGGANHRRYDPSGYALHRHGVPADQLALTIALVAEERRCRRTEAERGVFLHREPFADRAEELREVIV